MKFVFNFDSFAVSVWETIFIFFSPFLSTGVVCCSRRYITCNSNELYGIPNCAWRHVCVCVLVSGAANLSWLERCTAQGNRINIDSTDPEGNRRERAAPPSCTYEHIKGYRPLYELLKNIIFELVIIQHDPRSEPDTRWGKEHIVVLIDPTTNMLLSPLRACTLCNGYR